jgi:hypothetical protein
METDCRPIIQYHWELGADIDAIIGKIINSDSFMRDFYNVFCFQILEPLSEKKL